MADLLANPVPPVPLRQVKFAQSNPQADTRACAGFRAACAAAGTAELRAHGAELAAGAQAVRLPVARKRRR